MLGAPDERAISQMTWALKDGYAARQCCQTRPPPSMQPSGLAPCRAVAKAPMSKFVPLHHKATEGLCQWICARLAAPDLIRWVIENGCHPHPELAAQVRNRIADAKAPNGVERIWTSQTGPFVLEYLGEASSDFEASIDDHLQKRDFRCRPAYVQLLCVAWEHVAAIDSSRARDEVTHWACTSFALFRRFVLWSAGRPNGLSASESINYVNIQPASLLWGVDTGESCSNT